jgi:phage shock protein C
VSALDRRRDTATAHRFRLARDNRKLMGVCGGIADYFGWDANLVRIVWLVGTLLGFGALVLVYLAIALIAD